MHAMTNEGQSISSKDEDSVEALYMDLSFRGNTVLGSCNWLERQFVGEHFALKDKRETCFDDSNTSYSTLFDQSDQHADYIEDLSILVMSSAAAQQGCNDEVE